MRQSAPAARERAPRRAQRGFTLLEVAVTIGLLTIVAAGVMGLLIPLSSQLRLNREVSVANAEVRGLLERIQATPFADLPVDFPDGAVIEIADLDEGKLGIQYADPAADPLEITVSASWRSLVGGVVQWDFRTARTE